MARPKSRFDFRDVSAGLQILRAFLMGREHKLHGRFPPLISPRTIPTPDIPRGPEYKYSNQYYHARSAFDSVKAPVVAPIAQGPPVNQDPKMKVMAGGLRPDSICFACAPTPGLPWWWDGHCYYEVTPEPGQSITKPPTNNPPASPCTEPQG